MRLSMSLAIQRSLFIILASFSLLNAFFELSAAEVKPDLTLKIPMRDGVELTTDIYLPNPEAKNLPCILLRGPGGRLAPSAIMYTDLAKEGFVIAIQDTRSAIDLEGKTLPFYSDGWGKEQDGYDTVQWLAQHPLTNGKIGTLGISNMGITQLLMAPTAPPALKCQYIGVAAASLYHHALFPGGTLLKNQVEGWLNLCAKHPSVLDFVCNQPVYNNFWEEFNTIKMAHQVNVPAVHTGGWFDTFIQGTIDAFVSRQEQGGPNAKGKQKLLIGPWTHRWPAHRKIGEFDVPALGYQPPYDLSPLRWFDFYLKGLPNKIETVPAVVYYVMGTFDGSPSSGNVWRTSNMWPVPHQDTPFYLTKEKHLSEKLPPDLNTILTYQHNIDDPVPTLGGRNLFLDSGPVDQNPIEQRKDVLVFTTEPLKEDVEVTGRVYAKLFFASNSEKTDLAVRLTDVYPDGKSLLIADNLVQTNHVNHPHQELSKPQEVEIDLWSTSLVFSKGHRIRVIVSGSNYPRFEKNTKHEGNSIHMHHLNVGTNTPSQIILPIVRRGNHWVATQVPSQTIVQQP
jgi:uncharacterized protein